MTAADTMNAIQSAHKALGLDMNLEQAQVVLTASRGEREKYWEKLANAYLWADDKPHIAELKELLIPDNERTREDRETTVDKAKSECPYNLDWIPNGKEVVAEPNEAFWTDWRKNKDTLKSKGYQVSKNVWKWEVSKPA